MSNITISGLGHYLPKRVLTNRDLEKRVQKQLFRLDLYYRLSVIPLTVPALRDRKECLLPLIRSFIDRFAERSAKPKRLTRSAIDRLASYPFPGNVRELMNICERLVVMTDTEMIDVSDLPRAVVMGSDDEFSAVTVRWPEVMSMAQILESVERAVLVEASRSCRSQQEIAAALDAGSVLPRRTPLLAVSCPRATREPLAR